ncbi:MAG: DUF3750 domain-containing protein [Candidatus Paceibacterota bacterium]|jgi:hypothetical protein
MDDNREFFKLIDKEKYQVFLFACPTQIPLNIALHSWFVVNNQGKISRWEILSRQVSHKTKWDHLYLNFFLPFQGVEIISSSKKYFWKPKLLGKIEGKIAQQMCEFIEKSPISYPYCDKYHWRGPNSNTYTQWIINNFSEFSGRLPWRAIGKNYKMSRLRRCPTSTLNITKLSIQTVVKIAKGLGISINDLME